MPGSGIESPPRTLTSMTEKETEMHDMPTTQDITAFIDQWLIDNRGWVSDVSVDFALDVRNMVEQLARLELAEPVGV